MAYNECITIKFNSPLLYRNGITSPGQLNAKINTATKIRNAQKEYNGKNMLTLSRIYRNIVHQFATVGREGGTY